LQIVRFSRYACANARFRKLLKVRVYIDLLSLSEEPAPAALLGGLQREGIVPTEPPTFPPSAAKAKRFPGALPEIWEVPLLRNPNFTGRDQMLDRLHSALRSGRPAALTQAIAGLGGVGKTQLALEYAYRYASEYSLSVSALRKQPAQLESSEQLMRRAVRILESTYGPEHPGTKGVATNLELLEAQLTSRKGSTTAG
jgi:hypothetical protein